MKEQLFIYKSHYPELSNEITRFIESISERLLPERTRRLFVEINNGKQKYYDTENNFEFFRLEHLDKKSILNFLFFYLKANHLIGTIVKSRDISNIFSFSLPLNYFVPVTKKQRFLFISKYLWQEKYSSFLVNMFIKNFVLKDAKIITFSKDSAELLKRKWGGAVYDIRPGIDSRFFASLRRRKKRDFENITILFFSNSSHFISKVIDEHDKNYSYIIPKIRYSHNISRKIKHLDKAGRVKYYSQSDADIFELVPQSDVVLLYDFMPENLELFTLEILAMNRELIFVDAPAPEFSERGIYTCKKLDEIKKLLSTIDRKKVSEVNQIILDKYNIEKTLEDLSELL